MQAEHIPQVNPGNWIIRFELNHVLVRHRCTVIALERNTGRPNAGVRFGIPGKPMRQRFGGFQ